MEEENVNAPVADKEEEKEEAPAEEKVADDGTNEEDE